MLLHLDTFYACLLFLWSDWEVPISYKQMVGSEIDKNSYVSMCSNSLFISYCIKTIKSDVKLNRYIQIEDLMSLLISFLSEVYPANVQLIQNHKKKIQRHIPWNYT